MTTSPKMSLKSVVSREDTQLSPAQLGYMNGRAKNQAHSAVLKLFLELSAAQGLTRAFLARRLGKKPEQITRWLGAPGNWTLDTLSNLLAAMGYEPVFSVRDLQSHKQENRHHPLASFMSTSNIVLPEDNKIVLRNEFGGELSQRPLQTSNYVYDALIPLDAQSQPAAGNV